MRAGRSSRLTLRNAAAAHIVPEGDLGRLSIVIKLTREGSGASGFCHIDAAPIIVYL
jgi:hypothetical protein